MRRFLTFLWIKNDETSWPVFSDTEYLKDCRPSSADWENRYSSFLLSLFLAFYFSRNYVALNSQGVARLCTRHREAVALQDAFKSVIPSLKIHRTTCSRNRKSDGKGGKMNGQLLHGKEKLTWPSREREREKGGGGEGSEKYIFLYIFLDLQIRRLDKRTPSFPPWGVYPFSMPSFLLHFFFVPSIPFFPPSYDIYLYNKNPLATAESKLPNGLEAMSSPTDPIFCNSNNNSCSRCFPLVFLIECNSTFFFSSLCSRNSQRIR